MAIEQFGKITYDDINNLENNSIKTATITANTFIGSKFRYDTLYEGKFTPKTTITLNSKYTLYEFLVISYVLSTTSYQTVIGPLILHVPTLKKTSINAFQITDDSNYCSFTPTSESTFYLNGSSSPSTITFNAENTKFWVIGLY